MKFILIFLFIFCSSSQKLILDDLVISKSRLKRVSKVILAISSDNSDYLVNALAKTYHGYGFLVKKVYDLKGLLDASISKGEIVDTLIFHYVGDGGKSDMLEFTSKNGKKKEYIGIKKLVEILNIQKIEKIVGIFDSCTMGRSNVFKFFSKMKNKNVVTKGLAIGRDRGSVDYPALGIAGNCTNGKYSFWFSGIMRHKGDKEDFFSIIGKMHEVLSWQHTGFFYIPFN